MENGHLLVRFSWDYKVEIILIFSIEMVPTCHSIPLSELLKIFTSRCSRMYYQRMTKAPHR